MNRERLQAVYAAVERGFLWTAAIVVLAFAVQYVFTAESHRQYDFFVDELERIREQNRALLVENEQRRLQIDGIQHDDRYLEQVARQEFGMIRKGEVLYKFKEASP